MKIKPPFQKLARYVLTCFVLTFFYGLVQAQLVPFDVKYDLFDHSNSVSLGLSVAEGTQTIPIFKPTDSTDHFTNGVVMIAFKDNLYCMWQSSAKDEDAADTWVAYSRSSDGIVWTEPMILSATIENGYCSSGGWWVAGDTIVGYINTWPSSVSPRGGYTRYVTSTDGLAWSEPKAVLMADGDTLMGIFEQDPHALPDGRIINAAHFQPGLIICPIYTDDPTGVRGWAKAEYTNLSISGGISREIEPSWFLRKDDTLVMTFRDQNGTFKRLASVSGDRGESWTTAVLTNMPDARTKQSAGNFTNGTAFMVGNPVNNKTRIPLVATLSPNGQFFNTAYILRHGGDSIQALRYTGKAKRLGYHYPKSMVYNDYLYVSYATNKEDAEYTRFPLANVVLDTTTVNPITSVKDIAESLQNDNIKIIYKANKSIKITLENYAKHGSVSIINLNGQLLYTNKIENNTLQISIRSYPTGSYIILVSTDLGKKSQLIYKQ